MAVRNEVIHYLDNLLTPSLFRDYCPNGLQVQGKESIHKVITGVTANIELFQLAQEKNADAVLVHHGIFWTGTPQALTHVRYERIKKLMDSDINLIAYHLPLDAHPLYGNNAQLAQQLKLDIEAFFDIDNQKGLGLLARAPQPLTHEAFTKTITQTLKREPLVIQGKAPQLSRIAICTGGAQSYLPQMIDMGVDAYITGEHSLAMVELAREAGITFISAGHHATERYGVQAIGELLKKDLDLDVEFVDIPNPA